MSGYHQSLTDKQINDIYDYWYESDCNTAQTAKHFKLARSTIHRYRKRYDWDTRVKKIKADIQNKQDKKIISREVKNLEVIKAVFKKEAHAFLSQDHKATGDPKNLVVLARYIDEIEGSMPNNGGDTIVNIIQQFKGDTTELRRELENGMAGIPESESISRF